MYQQVWNCLNHFSVVDYCPVCVHLQTSTLITITNTSSQEFDESPTVTTFFTVAKRSINRLASLSISAGWLAATSGRRREDEEQQPLTFERKPGHTLPRHLHEANRDYELSGASGRLAFRRGLRCALSCVNAGVN